MDVTDESACLCCALSRAHSRMPVRSEPTKDSSIRPCTKAAALAVQHTFRAKPPCTACKVPRKPATAPPAGHPWPALMLATRAEKTLAVASPPHPCRLASPPHPTSSHHISKQTLLHILARSSLLVPRFSAPHLPTQCAGQRLDGCHAPPPPPQRTKTVPPHPLAATGLAIGRTAHWSAYGLSMASSWWVRISMSLRGLVEHSRMRPALTWGLGGCVVAL
jgi:hypothetical protein